MSKNSGKLIFVFGEMGSGKTAKLIDDIKSHSRDEAVVMKPSVDTKNGDSLLSRNGNSIETDAVVAKDVNIYELVKRDYFDKNYLYFDEAQFISREQANQLLRIASDFDMEVRAYGLRLNFKIGDENFEGATRLLQISHELICIESKCDFCEK